MVIEVEVKEGVTEVTSEAEAITEVEVDMTTTEEEEEDGIKKEEAIEAEEEATMSIGEEDQMKKEAGIEEVIRSTLIP